MSPDSDSGATALRVAVDAFDAAVARYREGRSAGHPLDRSFVPLAEALWWAIIADEGFEQQDAWPGYRDDRDDDPAGRVLLGLRFARNSVGHQRAFVVRRVHFQRYVEGPSGHWYRTYQRADGGWSRSYEDDLHWRPAEELPAVDPGHEKHVARLRDEYQASLEARSADETLQACRDWLLRALDRVETP